MLKLLRNLRRQEWAMAAVCAVLILGQIYFDLALPDYMSSLTVLIKTPGSTLSDILHTGLEMLGCTLASAVLCVICGYLTAKVAAGFSFSIREAVFHKIADFGQQEMMTFSVPSLINRTTNDITQVQMLTAMGLQILIKSPVMAVWAIIKIVGKSWTLSAITAGFVAALLVMMAVIIGVVVPRFRRVQKLTDHINLVARENLNGINVVHAYNAEDYQNAKFWKGNEELMRTQLFNQRAFAFLMPGVTLAMNALSLVIYWVGASIVNAVPAADTAARLAAFSDIVVFGTYATYVIMSIMMMVMIIMMLPAAQVSAQRINEVLETRNSLTQGARIDALETGTVEFRDVSFHYPSSDKNVLEHITFQAKRGETVAFIGATGSGKTTLVSLAARFYDATEGTVLVDGVDVRDYTFDALYDRIGYVTQKAILFSGDVRGNVLFGASRGKDSDADVQKALELAQASEFVDRMPGGIHAPIAEGGTNVSGGQKQRLSIARALARRPEILVFDDSFSALDYRTDTRLRAGLDRELKETVAFIGATGSGKTTLVSLAARFYDATEGTVLVDGVDVRDYTFDALYDRIGYVTQKAILFSGDVRGNVLFGASRGKDSDADVQKALELAQASEFVDRMPGGIHAPIAEGGTNVSGGQKQRLSIARALARRPEILVFDDSFSALDYRTDTRLRAGLDRELKDTTRLIVAQRIGTIRNADKIIVLDEGRMVGMGTHEELMQTCPIYQEIARSQLSQEELGA